MTCSPEGVAIRPAPLPICGLVLCVLAAPQLSAQSVTGRVVDAASGDPVPEARVQATPTAETAARVSSAITDRGGHFRLSLEPGTWDLVVERVGYETVHTTGLQVVVDEGVTLEIRLGPRPAALEPLVVTGRRRYAARTRPFYDRMAFNQGRGRFIDRQELERYPPAVPIDMWHQTKPSIAFRRCVTTAVFVDGVPVPPEFLSDYSLRLEDLEGVEIYRSKGSVPHELSIASIKPYPDCAVVYWTRREFYDRPDVTPRRVAMGAVLYGALLVGGVLVLSVF
jgi:hypothetical protein